MTKAYTFGYSGRNPALLAQALAVLDGVLFDIRFSPYSRDQRWNGKTLRAGLGARYRHVKAFGNKNYKGAGPIEIVDVDAGVAEVEAAVAAGQVVVLMCACHDYHTCHRKVVAEALQARGYEVEELDPAKIKATIQPGFFDS